MRKMVILSAAALVAVGCTTNPYTGERRAGRVVTSGAAGAGAGAAAGAIIGAIAGDAAKGAVIGAGVGGATGIGIGVYQDQQQEKLRQRLARSGVSISRNGDSILLNMPSDITFETASADVTSNFYETLNAVAITLNEYDKTAINVYGHADARGSDEFNQDLSERRAISVSDYLVSQGINGQRLLAVGFGEKRPVADNESARGQALNRRVEIVIDPIESAF